MLHVFNNSGIGEEVSLLSSTRPLLLSLAIYDGKRKMLVNIVAPMDNTVKYQQLMHSLAGQLSLSF